MARPIRVEFPGAIYHVTARGNERRRVFFGEEDCRLFLRTLGEACGQFRVRAHAWCLMPNHYHLVVETPEPNLSRAMGWLQTTFTVRYNRRHRRCGHLFQGRFKAVVVDADAHARWLVCYVHLNPVRGRRNGAVVFTGDWDDLEAHPWSSHRYYRGEGGWPDWQCLDWLGYWHPSRRKEAHRLYRNHICDVMGQPEMKAPWDSVRGGLVLGGDDLWVRVKGLVADKQGSEETRWKGRASAEGRQERVRELCGEETDWRWRIWLRVRLGGERPVDVGRDLGYRNGAGVLEVVKRLEARAAHDPTTRSKLARYQAWRIES